MDTSDKIKLAVLGFFLLLSIICFVLRIYVVIHFANTPIAEVPTWAYVFMSK